MLTATSVAAGPAAPMSARPRIDLSVVVVNYNTAHLLGEMMACLERASLGLSLQLIVVDNASRDGSAEVLARRCPAAQLIFNEQNIGFGRANNQALPLLEGRQVLLLNTDAFVSADALHQTMAYLDAHDDVGIVGVRLEGRDGSLQPSCRYFPTLANTVLLRAGLMGLAPWARPMDDLSWDHRGVRECDWVPGCFYLMRKEVLDRVGLFDPRYFLYYEEIDHCRAVKAAGWKVVCLPDVSVVHIGGESARQDGAVTDHGSQISVLQVESELLYFRKQHGLAAAVGLVLLHALADAWMALKTLLKGRGVRALRPHWQHAREVVTLFRRTRWASAPTR